MSRTEDSARSTLLALAALTAAAALLRFVTLSDQSYWVDESVTVHLLRMDLGSMLRQIPKSESTPPLYYLIAWLWAKLFGLGEFGLRSLSALIGTATIPLAFLAARELCSRRVGLAVAALAAVSPILVWYSQEARAYALVTALSALSLWAFARLLREPSRRFVVAWALASALALATHYFAAFLVLPEAVWLAAAPPTRRAAAPALAAVAVAGLALLPLALHQSSLDLASFIKGESLPFRVAQAGKNLLVGFDSPLERELAAVAVLIALAGAAGVFAWARGRERAGGHVALALGLLVVGLPVVLAAAGVDYLDSRNVLPAWIPLMTVVAAGLLPAGRTGVAALVLLGLLGLAGVIGVAVTPKWQREDWRGMAHALGPATEPRVIITPATGRRPLDLYLGRPPARRTGGAVVREIALLYPVRRQSFTDPLPPPRLATSAPGGFTLARRRVTDSYAIAVLRAPRPVPVSVINALSLRPSRGESTAFLLQRPRR